MALLAKLLSLGDSLRELRQRQAMAEQQQQQKMAQTEWEEDGEEDEEREKEDQFHPTEEFVKKKQPTMMVYGRQRRQRNPIPPEFGAPQEVTRLFVREGDEEEDEEEEEEMIRPSVQYFSRKNSVKIGTIQLFGGISIESIYFV
jgi:hypothetical protein